MALVKPHTHPMTTADKVTSVRLILAPFFFGVYFLPEIGNAGFIWTVPVLWLLFIISELTDLLDGQIARSRNEVSDFGKLFDPFADTLVRITYFLCFVKDGILPVVLFAVVLYREFGILFIRMLMTKRGITMGARMSGKIKAVAYMVTGVLALGASSLRRLNFDSGVFALVRLVAIVVFIFAVLLSLTSFLDYWKLFKKPSKSDNV